MSKAKSSGQSGNQERSRAARPALARKRALKKPATTAAPTKSVARKSGKIAKIIAMLRRPKGASIGDLSKATDWQAHSVRGAISGAIKKKHGLNVASEKIGTARVYRVVDKAAG